MEGQEKSHSTSTPLDRREIYFLIDEIHGRETKLASRLGLEEATIRGFQLEAEDTEEATYAALAHWHKGVPDIETRCQLAVALAKCGLEKESKQVFSNELALKPFVSPLTEQQIKKCRDDIVSFYRSDLFRKHKSTIELEWLFQFGLMLPKLGLLQEDSEEKVSVQYSDLLSLQINEKPLKRIVIEGDRGSGKTALCERLVWDWINGTGFQKYFLVLYIPLTYERPDTSLGEIVKSYLSPENDAAPDQLDDYFIKNQDKIFVIVNGQVTFVGDAARHALAPLHESRAEIRHIIGAHRFKDCSLLVTTDTSSLRDIPQIREASTFIELEGFREEDIPTYVRKFFTTNKPAAASLVNFMKRNCMVAENMAPFPIYTSMLCIMWRNLSVDKRNEVSRLQPISKIIKFVVSFFLEQAINKDVQDLNEAEAQILCDKIKQHQLDIGKIALQELVQWMWERRLGRTVDTFDDYQEASRFGFKVGLLRQETYIVPKRCGLQWRENGVMTDTVFQHDLFQEFMAGMYLASLYSSQRELFNEIIDYILSRGGEFWRLIYFTAMQERAAAAFIMARLCERYDRPENASVVLGMAFECDGEQLISVAERHYKSKTQSDGTFISVNDHITSQTTLAFVSIFKNLKILCIRRRCHGALSYNIARAVTSLANLQQLYIYAGSVSADFHHAMATRSESLRVKSVSLEGLELTDHPAASQDAATWLCSLPCLQTLEFDDPQLHDMFYSAEIPLRIENLSLRGPRRSFTILPMSSVIAKWICSLPCLKKLELAYSEEIFFKVLLTESSPQSQIETVTLSNLMLTNPVAAVRDAARWIASLSHLKELNLYIPHLHEGFFSTLLSVESFAKMNSLTMSWIYFHKSVAKSREAAIWITSLTHLRQLTLSLVDVDGVFFSVLRASCALKSLHSLTLRNMHVGNSSSTASDAGRWISSLPSLSELSICTYIPEDDFFVALVESSSKVVSLTLEGSMLRDTTEVTRRNLANWISSNPSLTSLRLMKPLAHDDFWLYLASAKTSKVQTLKLEIGHVMSPSVSTDVARWVCSMSCLKELLTVKSHFQKDFYAIIKAALTSKLSLPQLVTVSFNPEDIEKHNGEGICNILKHRESSDK